MILKAYKKVLFSAINCIESFVCLNIIIMYTAHALQNIQFGSSVSQWIHDKRYEINK